MSSRTKSDLLNHNIFWTRSLSYSQLVLQSTTSNIWKMRKLSHHVWEGDTHLSSQKNKIIGKRDSQRITEGGSAFHERWICSKNSPLPMFSSDPGKRLSSTDNEENICFVQQLWACLPISQPKNCHGHNTILMWWLIILILHKSFIVCQIQSPQATWAPDFYKSTFQRCKSTIHIIFNYVRAGQDHCLYNITGWRKWDSVLLPSKLSESRWYESGKEKAVLWNYVAAIHPSTTPAQWNELPSNCPTTHAQ